MAESKLSELSMDFAVNILKLCDSIKICEKLAGHDGVWYATNIEIHDYVEAFRALHVSADGRRVFNPTAQTLWFNYNDKNYKIEPGQSLFTD